MTPTTYYLLVADQAQRLRSCYPETGGSRPEPVRMRGAALRWASEERVVLLPSGATFVERDSPEYGTSRYGAGHLR